MLGFAFLKFIEFALLLALATVFALARWAYLKFERHEDFDEILADTRIKKD